LQSLGFVAPHLRWVPHALSDTQKGDRVNLSRRLLRMPEVQRDRAWHDILTVDEPWFYLSTDYEFVWLPRDEKFPKENDTQFNRRKLMLMIVWNPRGFHLIEVIDLYASSPEIMSDFQHFHEICESPGLFQFIQKIDPCFPQILIFFIVSRIVLFDIGLVEDFD
jgi:hypothetical protein